jgi:hypothetical protein
MIEGLFFALDIFFAVALVYWVYAADSAPGEDPKGLFRWIQRKRDQRLPSTAWHGSPEQRRDFGKH